MNNKMRSAPFLLLIGLVTADILGVSQSARCGPDFDLTCQGSVFGNCKLVYDRIVEFLTHMI